MKEKIELDESYESFFLDILYFSFLVFCYIFPFISRIRKYLSFVDVYIYIIISYSKNFYSYI